MFELYGRGRSDRNAISSIVWKTPRLLASSLTFSAIVAPRAAVHAVVAVDVTSAASVVAVVTVASVRIVATVTLVITLTNVGCSAYKR